MPLHRAMITSHTECTLFVAIVCSLWRGFTTDVNVRLVHGTDQTGIVQVFYNDAWQVLCGWKVSSPEVAVICTELGYKEGQVLPLGAYGTHIADYSVPIGNCVGDEATILDCQVEDEPGPHICTGQNVYYAAVSCYDDILQSGPVYRLENNASPADDSYGVVSVYRYGTWGRICSIFWDNKDASVLCRQLGFAKGVAMQYNQTSGLPYVLSELNCVGNETDLDSCETELQICYDKISGGALCYRNSGPNIKLVDGDVHYGRVVIDVDGLEGAVCNVDWTEEDATVVCQQLGFLSGISMNLGQPSIEREVWMAGVDCMGNEGTILDCISAGWKEIDTECLSRTSDASVYCFRQVRLNAGRESDKFIMGRVEIHNDYFWNTLCGAGFDQTNAEIICRELGFSQAVILAPHSFGNHNFYTYITEVDCNGDEESITDCFTKQGSCLNGDYASLLCLKETIEQDMNITLNGSHGKLSVSMYGIEGTICREGWDNTDAQVVCREMGYAGGTVFGTPRQTSRSSPIWLTNVKCTGTEESLMDCQFEQTTSVSSECINDMTSAGVICYSTTGMEVRIVPPQNTDDDNYGLVMVARDGVWGTVCNNGWSYYDAVVVCHQLGYPSGRYLAKVSGPDDAPVYLDGVECDGSEASLFECSNRGWSISDVTCDQHKSDATVFCNKWVQIHYGMFSGPVNVWDGDNYGLVCSEGFDDNSANVVCKQQGFKSGISVCCSAFGAMDNLRMKITDVSCTGSESSLLDCQHKKSDNCASDRYASVVCSDISNADQLSVFINIESVRWGSVNVNYYGHFGYICSEGFDNNDANVICKEEGYSGGFAFKYYTSTKGRNLEVRWLSEVSCDGSESKLSDCSNLNWGNIGDCSKDTVAGVYCFADPDFTGITLKLQSTNSDHNSGFVEMNLDGRWGTICGKNFSRTEAAVVCRLLGFQDGIALKAGASQHEGPVWIKQIQCVGTETSITDCVFTDLANENDDCDNHTADAMVHCFETARIIGSVDPYFGRLEVFDGVSWNAVCSDVFGDVEANVACKQMGFSDGRAVCCSALGDLPANTPISMSQVNCQGGELKIENCNHQTDLCDQYSYVSLYCSDVEIGSADIKVRLPNNSFYGPVEVQRYGLWGYICDSSEWSDVSAKVVCKELGYKTGRAVHSYMDRNVPITMSALSCIGSENKLSDCDFAEFVDYECGDFDTVAAVLCSNSPVEFPVQDSSKVAEIVLSEASLQMEFDSFDVEAATAFCMDAGFASGTNAFGGFLNVDIFKLDCSNEEDSILNCKGLWEPGHEKLALTAGVICNHEVRLRQGDEKSYGVLEVYTDNKWGRVCSSEFDDVDADVACRRLGYEKGLTLCCYPFGYHGSVQSYNHVDCHGDEEFFTDCPHVEPTPGDFEFCVAFNDYASVKCYNGTIVDDYSLTLSIDGAYTGDVVFTYLGVQGRICSDGWTDEDAYVTCREMGFPNGTAYHHYFAESSDYGISGPLWTSEVQCLGVEELLIDCPHTPVGEVKSCESGHYAGVLCHSKTGIYYKLAGGDNRYGRVEVSINGGWMSMCNTFWDLRDSQVYCRQIGYKTGDPFYGEYLFQGIGPVWDSKIYCSGEETDLNDCPHTGWTQTTSSRCAFHKHDAGVFCYIDVRLHNGIGRTTDRGAVLFYDDDDEEWYTICDEGFTEASAKVVCRELGFYDGEKVCCSSHGRVGFSLLFNKTVRCDGTETRVSQCLKEEACDSQKYASVICYRHPPPTAEPTTVQTEPTTNKPSTIVADNKDTIIIGVTVTAIALLILVIILAFCIIRKKKSRDVQNQNDGNDPHVAFDSVHYTTHPHEAPPAYYSNLGYDSTPNEPVLQESPPYGQASASSPDYENSKSDLGNENMHVRMPESDKDYAYKTLNNDATCDYSMDEKKEKKGI